MLTETIVFVALAIAAYADLRTREVPDWLNYSMIAAGLGFASIKSVIYWDYWFLAYSAVGLAVFVGLAYFMFYTAQWGGGDSKLLMGLGAMFGLRFSTSLPFTYFDQPLVQFLVNLLFVAVAYGFLWSIALAVVKRKKSFPKFREYLERFRKTRLLILLFAVLGLMVLFLSKNFLAKLSIVTLVLLVFITFYVWLLVKAVEESCLYKYVSPEVLTEGDWVAKEVKIGKRYVCGPKDLGLSKSQIRKLLELKKKKKISKVLVKEGIPFVPSFLITYAVTLIFGNIVSLFM